MTPNYTFKLVANPVAGGPFATGDCLVESAGEYVLSTAANRGTKKSSGIAIGAAAINDATIMQTVGDVSTTISGIGPGAAGELVRVSSTGRLERVASPGASDDVVGIAEASGLVHLFFGMPIQTIATLASYIVAAGDGVRVTLSGSTYTVHGVRGTCSLEQFGAVGNNAALDSAAMTAACAAIAAGTYGTLVCGAKRYDLSNATYNLPDGASIVGQGWSTVFYTSANAPVFNIVGEGVTLRHFRMEGNSTGANQTGIKVGSAGVAGSGKARLLIEGIEFENLGGKAYEYAQNPFTVYHGPIVANCSVKACGHGFWLDARGEYSNFFGCTVDACPTGKGLYVGAGNVSWSGGSITNCSECVDVAPGANDAHGIVCGAHLNHSSRPVQVGAILNGFEFVGCNIFQGVILLTSSVGVSFKDCRIDVELYRFDGSVGTLFDAGCRYSASYPNTVEDNYNGNASQTLWEPGLMRDDLSIPPWIQDRIRVPFTFPADANATLTTQQSTAAAVHIQAGVITAARDLQWSAPPNKGQRRLVRNGSAQTVNLRWATGASVALGPGLGAIFGADGVNATLELKESAGTSPGGSDTQFQWNNGGAFAGASGLTYHAGTNRPDMPNGWRVTGAATATFVITPTGARTITFQDATHTVVGRDTTDTLTNKTFSMSAIGNVLTDTGVVQYDLAMADVNGHFKRFAKGANSRVLTTSSGGVVQWDRVDLASVMVSGILPIGSGGTGATAVPGNDTYVIFNDGGFYGADSGLTFNKTSDVLSVGAGVAAGTTPATAGAYRAANNVVAVAARNSGNSGNLCLLATDSSNNGFLFGNSSFAEQVGTGRIYAGTDIYLGIGSTAYAYLGSSHFQFAVPVQGITNPFRWKVATVSITGNTTLTAAQYECPALYLSGSMGDASFTLTFPAQDGAFFTVLNSAQGNCLVDDGGATSCTILNTATSIVCRLNADYRKVA